MRKTLIKAQAKGHDSPSQIEPVELQQNLYHHGHAAKNESKGIFTAAAFTLRLEAAAQRETFLPEPADAGGRTGKVLPSSQVLPR